MQKENSENDDEKGVMLSLSDLSRRMHFPVNYKSSLSTIYDEITNNPETSLSYIPWKLNIISNNNINHQTADQQSAAQSSDIEKHPQEKDCINSGIGSFPSCSYLDLRREQNNSWASERHKEGMELFFINPTTAETKFLEGLDLVPDHVDLLVAYGRLLISKKNFESAEIKLNRALKLDPENKVAQEQLDRLRQRQSHQRQFQQQQELLTRNKKIQVPRESTAYNDVLMERALTMGGTMSDDEEGLEEQPKRSKRERKHKKSKKKRKRRRYSSASSSYDSSSYSSSDDESSMKDGGKEDKAGGDVERSKRPRRERKHKKSRKKKRRRRYSSSSSSYDSEDYPESDQGYSQDNAKKDDDDGAPDEESPSRRRKRKDRKHRKRHDRKYQSKRKKRKKDH